MTPEQLIQLLAAYAASGKEANTNVDNTQDLVAALLSPSLGVAGGTYDPTYAVPSQFTPVYGPRLSGALNSATPIWRQAATSILANDIDFIGAVQQIALALNVTRDLPNSQGVTYEDIQNEVQALFEEAASAQNAEAKFHDEQRKQLAENLYGKAGLPQPFAEYSIDPNVIASDPMLYAMLPPSLESLWSEKVAEDYRKLTGSRESDYGKSLNREMQAIYDKMLKESPSSFVGVEPTKKDGKPVQKLVQNKDKFGNVISEWVIQKVEGTDERGRPTTHWVNVMRPDIPLTRSDFVLAGKAAQDAYAPTVGAGGEEMDARRGIAMSYEAQKQAAEKMASEKADLESRKRAQAGLDERTRMIQLADLMTAREQQRTPLGDALMQRFMGLIGG